MVQYMINYAWRNGADRFDRFDTIEGKRVDVYSFTPRHELILVQNRNYNDRHD